MVSVRAVCVSLLVLVAVSHAADVDKMKATLKDLESKLKELKKKASILKITPPGKRPEVSFYARLQAGSSSQTGTIKFNDVKTNMGDDYDAGTGKFTAPLNGTYVFHATVGSNTNGDAAGDIFYGDKAISHLFAGKSEAGARRTGSGHVVINLVAGDEVMVGAESGASAFDGFSTTFSGFMLSVDPVDVEAFIAAR